MKIEGQLTIFANEGTVRLELKDKNACVRFLELDITADSLIAALGRLGHVPCEFEVRNLTKIGAVMEHKQFEFKLPGSTNIGRTAERDQAVKEVKIVCPEGWEPDLSFSSQNTFFTKEGHRLARTIIRRWV